MYPQDESCLPPKGSCPDHPPSHGPLSGSPRGGQHSRPEDSDKGTRDAADVLPPNKVNSSTMTCPELTYPQWPPNHAHAFPYPYGPMFCYPALPPYFPGPTKCNCCPQNVPLRVRCNNVNATSSGTSVGARNSSPPNVSSVHGNSDHILTGNQSYYSTAPYPYPTFYTPNPVLLQNSLGFPVVLTARQMFPQAQMSNQSRISLCCNCSSEIIPVVNESNVEEISVQAPLKITSFTDSMGRHWKCEDATVPKTGIRKGTENRRCSTAVESKTKKSTSSRLTSPSTERLRTCIDNIDTPQKKKKTKLRLRKPAEDVNVGVRTARVSVLRTLQPQTSNITKPVKVHNYACLDTSLARRSTTHLCTNKQSLKEVTSVSDNNVSVKNQSHGLLSQETCSMQPGLALTEKHKKNRADLKKPVGRERNISDVSPEDMEQNATVQSSAENSTFGPGTSSKLTKSTEENDDDDMSDKTSCNDFLERSVLPKDNLSTQRPLELNEDEFWLSSSSSSGTYDDSEAFDSLKLLQSAGVNTDTIRKSRQRSRERSCHTRAGQRKLTSARSEEELKRRNLSPKRNDKDERPTEQVIIDTSQVRITEETPKRFIVESKNGTSTSQKAVTITVQAEVPRMSTREVCNDCAMEGVQTNPERTCSCNPPPCQRPQWQSPPCPAGETHNAQTRHCHNAPPAGRTLQRHPSPQIRIQGNPRNEPNNGENLAYDSEEQRRMQRRSNVRSFATATVPWVQPNADRPHEENRHLQYPPPRPPTERYDGARREHAVPTNRTRRWHTQPELLLAELHGNRQAEEMMRIQIPNAFPRYRPYEYARNHNEEPAENREGAEQNVDRQNRKPVDMVFRGGGVRRLGTIRRSVRCDSPRNPSHGNEETPSPDNDTEGNLDFYRRPRSAITVSKTNYFSPRNRKLEEEVQRIQSESYGQDNPSTSSVKEEEDEDPEYPNKNCEEDQEFEDVEKPDCEYEENAGDKRDQDRHNNVEDED